MKLILFDRLHSCFTQTTIVVAKKLGLEVETLPMEELFSQYVEVKNKVSSDQDEGVWQLLDQLQAITRNAIENCNNDCILLPIHDQSAVFWPYIKSRLENGQ